MRDRFGLLYDASFEADLRRDPAGLDFLELIPDRFMTDDLAAPLPELPTAIPTVFHSLDLSLGSDEPLDAAYLHAICRLARHFKPMWASDHLAFTHLDGVHLGHLSPVRWSLASVPTIATRIGAVQNELRIPFLVENIAYYIRIPGADLTEGELLRRLVEQTGCGLLLDVNNVAVNALNHGFDPFTYLREFPLQAVREIHIAGHRKTGKMVVDSHGDSVDELVWDLLRFVAARVDPVNVLLERDQDIPPFAELKRELAIARRCVAEGRR